MIIEEMDSSIGKEADYKALLQQASTAYLNRQYNAALSKYNDALELANELKVPIMTKTILKYMVCLCLVESNKLKDLAEVVMMLQTLQKSVKDRFPDIYCLLAKAHCKLYRFDQAMTVINEGVDIYRTNRKLENFYIPGTNIQINQINEEIALKIREECGTWHKPDAICNLPECCNITAPYVTANRNIFLKDPAFNGMVVILCNNKKRPCSLKFHQCCWKYKKDQMYPFEKISDKDVLGNHCFTPNCLNDNIPCIISTIEVVGPNGEVKAHVKETISLPWPVHKNTSKGAIKKIKPTMPRKIEIPEMKKHSLSNNKIFVNEQISRNGYEDDQILAVKDEITNIDFSHECPEVTGEKNFLFSLFHDYIQNNKVRVSDVYNKFAEISEDLQLKSLDIMEFLLQTNKIVVLSKKLEQDSLPSQNQEYFKTSVKTEKIDKVNLNKTIDIDDMYNELMEDDYDYFEMTDDFTTVNENSNNKNQYAVAEDHGLHANYKLRSNAINTNFTCNQTSEDTKESIKNEVKNCTSYNFPSEHRSNEPEKKTSENRKLKEYIAKLDADMNEVMNKMSRLEKELKIKDAKITSLLKEQEEYSTKLNNISESWKNFQIRYDEIKEENINIKKEMITVLQNKKDLEEKLTEVDNRDTKKQELVKMFQEEYKILEEHINADWTEKTDKLENTLKHQIEINNSLLNKYLHNQYSYHRATIRGHLDQCATALEIISKINAWMESTLSIKNFIDNTEWFTRLNYLKNVLANHQNEYSQILQKIASNQIEALDVDIKLPHIVNPPSISLTDSIMNALNTFYKGQCHVMQSAMKLQQQTMAYQIPAMQVNNVPYNQFSQQYSYGSAYVPPRQPMIANPLIAPQMMNFQMQRMSMPPPVIPQNYAQPMHHLPKLIDVFSNGSDDKSIDSTSTNLLPDSTSSEDVATKIENLTNSVAKMKEEVTQEKKEEENVHNKEKIVVEKEEESKQSIDQINIRKEKMAKMKEACKAIALQVQQKNKLDSENDEIFDTASNKQLSIKNNVEEQGFNIDKKENVETNSLELLCTNSVNNSAVNSSEENTAKTKKKVGIDGLIKIMKQKFPESSELEIIEILSEIRRKHNNSLTKAPVIQILRESDEYMKQKHNLHLLRYNKNDGKKAIHNEMWLEMSARPLELDQNAKKIVISPASSCTSLNKLEESPVPKKKTWNKITKSEIQWTSSGEIECSICMNLVINKTECYTLSCRHSFHKQCVKSWLKTNRSCPNCRIAVTEDDEFPPLPA